MTGYINRLTPNDPYMGRTAPLTSKRCILHIYSTNIGTEGHKQTTKTSTKIQTKRTKKHRTTEEEMEGPISSGGLRNRLTCLTLREHDDDIGTEYFKYALYSPFFFSLQNAVCFIMLTCLVPV